jgi:hypothetical protein
MTCSGFEDLVVSGKDDALVDSGREPGLAAMLVRLLRDRLPPVIEAGARSSYSLLRKAAVERDARSV